MAEISQNRSCYTSNCIQTRGTQNFPPNLFIIEGKLFYDVVLTSAVHQLESAIGVHVSPPSLNSLPPPTPSYPSGLSEPQFAFPESLNKFPLVIYFTHCVVHASMLLCPFISPSLPPLTPLLGSISLFSMSTSPLLPCKKVHQYRLSRFHIYALIYYICLSLSELLHSV